MTPPNHPPPPCMHSGGMPNLQHNKHRTHAHEPRAALTPHPPPHLRRTRATSHTPFTPHSRHTPHRTHAAHTPRAYTRYSLYIPIYMRGSVYAVRNLLAQPARSRGHSDRLIALPVYTAGNSTGNTLCADLRLRLWAIWLPCQNSISASS